MEEIFTVQLLEKEFTIKTNEPAERMQRIVEFVNDYLTKIQSQRPFTDRLIISLLAALNITGEYMEVKEEKLALEKEVEKKANYLINLIDQYLEEVPCGVRDQ